MMADTKKRRDYLERYECSEDVKRLDGGLNFANNYLVALTSIKEDPVPEKIGNKPKDFVVERQKEQKSVEDKDLSKCSEDIQEFMEIFCEDQPKAYWDGVADTLEWIKEHPNNQFMQKPAERVEINKSLRDAVIAELDKYNGENHWKSPWAIDSTGLQYPLYFANLGATWQKEQKPILEVFGFKVGDAVRLKDGDGRKHIIKSFEEVEGVHGPNFYHVEFEDNSARDGIYPGEEYPNGYYTQMEKFEEEQKPAWSEEDLIHLTNAILSAEKEWGIKSCTAKWLKSLPERFNLQPKPSWKPSEEQIAALKWQVEHPELVKWRKGDLESLLEQLEKL